MTNRQRIVTIWFCKNGTFYLPVVPGLMVFPDNLGKNGTPRFLTRGTPPFSPRFPCRRCNKEKSHNPSVPWFSGRLSFGVTVVPVDISGYSERSSGCPPGVKAGNIPGVNNQSRRWDNVREAHQSTDNPVYGRSDHGSVDCGSPGEQYPRRHASDKRADGNPAARRYPEKNPGCNAGPVPKKRGWEKPGPARPDVFLNF
jgi:hypothetical protein